MTRFHDLSALAANRSHHIEQYQADCKTAGEALARAWHRHLDAPEERVVYRELESGLRFGKFRWPVTRAFPGFVGNRDGWLYFAIATTFVGSDGEAVFVTTSLFGIRLRGGKFVVLSGKKEREFMPDDSVALDRICEELSEEYRRYLSSAVNEEPELMGFRVE